MLEVSLDFLQGRGGVKVMSAYVLVGIATITRLVLKVCPVLVVTEVLPLFCVMLSTGVLMRTLPGVRALARLSAMDVVPVQRNPCQRMWSEEQSSSHLPCLTLRDCAPSAPSVLRLMSPFPDLT